MRSDDDSILYTYGKDLIPTYTGRNYFYAYRTYLVAVLHVQDNAILTERGAGAMHAVRRHT